MKNVKKRVGSFVLAFAVMITTVLCGVTPVQAKSSVVSADSVYTTGGTAAAGETRAIPFTLDANNGLEIYIIVPSPVEVKVLLFAQATLYLCMNSFARSLLASSCAA